MEKKTISIGVKISSATHKTVREILATTVTATISRFVQACFADLIKQTSGGERIAEPIQLLTVRQQRRLEALENQEARGKKSA